MKWISVVILIQSLIFGCENCECGKYSHTQFCLRNVKMFVMTKALKGLVIRFQVPKSKPKLPVFACVYSWLRLAQLFCFVKLEISQENQILTIIHQRRTFSTFFYQIKPRKSEAFIGLSCISIEHGSFHPLSRRLSFCRVSRFFAETLSLLEFFFSLSEICWWTMGALQPQILQTFNLNLLQMEISTLHRH